MSEDTREKLIQGTIDTLSQQINSANDTESMQEMTKVLVKLVNKSLGTNDVEALAVGTMTMGNERLRSMRQTLNSLSASLDAAKKTGKAREVLHYRKLVEKLTKKVNAEIDRLRNEKKRANV